MDDKRLRLFVDAHCFDGEYQGSRTFVQELYRVLIQRKNILFFFAAHDTELLQQIFPPAENIVFLKYRSRSFLYRLSYDIPLLIRRHRIDLAHFQYITPLIKNCRQVVTIHDVLFRDHPQGFSTPYRLAKQWLYRRAARRADTITTVSSFSKKSIHRYLYVPEEKIGLVPNGVHPRFFELYCKACAKKEICSRWGFDRFILYVSRVEPRKNHSLLVRSFIQLQLHEQGYHLVLLGHPTLPVPELHQLLQQLTPKERQSILLKDQVSDEELLRLYRAADLFVYPSAAEGFGIPPLEAAAARIPVVCSNRTAMKDFSFFGGGHTDPTDEQQFQNAIKQALNNQDEEGLENIAQLVRKKYSWPAAAYAFYQSIHQKQRS